MTTYDPPSPRSSSHSVPQKQPQNPFRQLINFFRGPSPEENTEQRSEQEKKETPDERLAKWREQNSHQKNNFKIDLAASVLLSRISETVAELETKEPVNDIEALINERKVAIGRAVAELELPIRNLTLSDRDQLSGMLKMARKGEIHFAEGAQKISLHGDMSPDLRKTLSLLSSIHQLAMVGDAQAKGDLTLYSRADDEASPSILYPLTQSNEESPEKAFAREAVVLLRVLHPFGDMPFAKVAGRGAIGFKTAQGEIHLEANNFLRVRVEDDGKASVTYYSPIKGKEPETYSLGYGEQLIIGRPLHISKLFGLSFASVSVKPDIHLDGTITSRAGLQLIRESREDGGGIIPLDRGSRHRFALTEQYARGSERIDFNPHGTLKNRGSDRERFSGGESIMG